MPKFKKIFFSRLLILPTIFYILSTILSGCVTLPVQDGLPVYYIGGSAYYPLASLCERRNIELNYDAVTRIVNLERDAKRVTLRPGDALILIDGRPTRLIHPVDIYQGTVVVPRQFKEQVLDVLFKQPVSYQRYATARIRLHKVVIDPGHGGNDPGAIGRTGLREKDVNLDIAKRLSALLKQEGVQTVMTRSTDKFIPLPVRVNIANHSGADLFVSVHSNASRTRSLNGFEVYYVAPSVSDSKRAYFSTRNATLDLKDAEFASSSTDLKAIIWDMIYTNSRAESIELSHSICRSIDSDLNVKILGVKSARFQVLKGIKMPGVLVETGFVSNYSEEKLLRSNAYRQKIAEGILEGIRDYSQGLVLMEASRG
ncbi:MAG: N-acetylmuramoyl-L-alanine amidase [Candidatus Omnitrophota bacterium]